MTVLDRAQPWWNDAVRRGVTPACAVCVFLALWGCLAIYNATYHLSAPYSFVGRQFVWVLVGTAVLVLSSALPATFYYRATPVLAGVAYALLWLVLWFGIRINGMRGWFAFHGVFVQPSELAKPAYILSLAYVLQRTRSDRQSFVRGYLPAVALTVAWAIPIVLQPDFGMLVVYMITFVAVYWCMSGRAAHLASSCVVALPLVVWAFRTKPHLGQRVIGFLRPEQFAQTAGWHILQFQRTLASGGLLGRSWGRGVWAQAYLPLGYSDSIFSSLGETVGFVGLLPIVLTILAWVVYGHWHLRQPRSDFVAAAVLGIVTMLGVQAFVHLGVNLGLLPPTGITLPLISYGGSSLVSTFAAVGLVESLVRDSGCAQNGAAA